MRLDPQDADAHATLAWMLGFTGDFAQSEIEFERALDLNPNSADILTNYANLAGAFSGDPETAVAAAERAIRLNPNAPLWAVGAYRFVYYEARAIRRGLALARTTAAGQEQTSTITSSGNAPGGTWPAR